MNELITSGVKLVLANGSSKKPWMIDGAGIPPNASELLPALVNVFTVPVNIILGSLSKKILFRGYL